MLCLALVAGLVTVPEIAHASPGFTPTAAQRERSVPGTDLRANPNRTVSQSDQRGWAGAPAVRWPAAGTAQVDVPVAGAAPAHAGALPVRVARPAQVASAAGTPTRLGVTVADRATTGRVGVTGVLLSVRRADGGASAGSTTVQVDYSGFRGAYGGDWSSRLRLVRLPACALSTPDRAECRTATPLPTSNDTATGMLSADVEVAGAATVLAATAAPVGSAGTYSATSLSPSGHWTAGGNSGSFGWSYDIDVPSVPGELEPDISLDYSSASVDGRTASTNNQPSWVGEGWDYDPGYIERQYAGCTDDMGTGANNTTKTGDLCWKTDNATLQLNGRSTTLVKDDTTGTWRLADDDGSRVEHLTGTSTDTANGDNDNEYWRVTTTDGTQYWFGKNRLPGWATGKTETASTYTAPVFGNNSGEPCHATTFAASFCNQAWRWQLDYVVDPHGDAEAYFYTKETNSYAKNNATTATATYVRGGYLNRIEYGHRAGQVYAATAPATVTFGVDERCLSTCTTFDAAHAANWPDTPVDQACAASASCLVTSPTFWSRKRLTSIKTAVLVGTTYTAVDSWALTQQFPGTGDNTSASLWLATITRTGDTGTAITTPQVDFGGTAFDNRVDSDEGRPGLHKYRITRISNESGGDTLVTYSTPDCAYASLPTQENNSTACYPMWWTPDGYTAPVQDWFLRYLVTRVTDHDKVAGSGSADQVTSYEYLGGAAWHRDDSEFTLDKHRGWNMFRGYGTVRVREGSSAASMTDTTYFRGMDGDLLPGGTTRSVTVADSEGNAVTDSDALAGTERETVTYTGDGGAVDAATVTDPWVSAPTATHARTGLPALVARYTDAAATRERQLISTATGTAWRRSLEKHTYNADGLEVTDEDQGDTAVTGDETCDRTTYTTPDTTGWQLSYVSDEQTTTGTCDVAASATTIRSEDRTYYDSQDLGVAPKAGQAHETRKETLDHFSGTTPVFLADTATFDAYDRQLTGTDEVGNVTRTAYTPATGAVPTSTAETDAKGRVDTETLNVRGQTTVATDANGRTTYSDYDALGRLAAVWLPGRARSASADETYTYTLSRTAPSVISTMTLQDNGSYLTSLTIYDGMLRERQTQSTAHGGGRVIEDTFYDSHGRDWKTNHGYWNTAAPTGTLFGADDSAVPAQTVETYDGQDRVTASILLSGGVEQWRTTTSYGGNWTATVPPSGGTATLTVTDAADEVLELRQFKTGMTPSFTAAASTYDDTRYTRDVDGHLTKLVDPAGNVWTYGYDLQDRQISASDPDSGTTTTTYDAAGRVATTTDSRGVTLAYTYDELDRKTTERSGSATGPKLAEWTYDTASGGLGMPASSIRYATDGSAYTTAVTGYDAAGQQTGTAITVPQVAGEEALAGTYTTGYTYTATGLLDTTTYPAVGGLPAETVKHTYTSDGLPSTMDNGQTVYVNGTQFTPYGELAQTTLGANGNRLVRTLTYADATRRLATVTDDRERTAPQTIDKRTYGYDPAGNVTRVRDDRDDATTADDQCFRYDYQRRLTDAWTATDACAAGPSTATVGGVAPYWQTFAYDLAGNRTTEVRHGTTGATGDVTRTYGYPGAGKVRPHTLTSVVSTGAVARTDSYGYDAAGNTTSRVTAAGGQTLEWDAEGMVAKSTVGGAATSFLYDTDGDRLLRRDPTSTTLYAGDDEITLNRTTGALSGVRHYEVPDATVVRSSTGTVSYLLADHHGTDELQVDAATLAYTRRDTTPFGAVRGTAPASWPDDKGFVGGTADATLAGLTELGAREYDPDTGRFISVDPVLDTTDSQQINGYVYSNSNPVTMSDPDGNWAVLPGGHYCDACGGYSHAPKPKKHYYKASGHPTQRFKKGTAKYRKNLAESKREERALRRAAARHAAARHRAARKAAAKKKSGCHGFFGCLGHVAKKVGHVAKKIGKAAWKNRTTILSVCAAMGVLVCGVGAMISGAFDAYSDFRSGHYLSGALDVVGVVSGGAGLRFARLAKLNGAKADRLLLKKPPRWVFPKTRAARRAGKVATYLRKEMYYGNRSNNMTNLGIFATGSYAAAGISRDNYTRWNWE
jgi:RHS repeat-associated protein